MVLSIAGGRVLGRTCQSGFHYANGYILLEVAYEHDVGIVFVELGEEQVAAVRGNGDAIVKIASGFDFKVFDLSGNLLQEVKGTAAGTRITVD